MGVLTKDPNVLMRRWMEVYMNLNMMLSTDPRVSKILDEMKPKLAECNEHVMAFFDMVGAKLEEEAEEEKAKEPEIVECSCGETFDWENWDRGTFPVPKGVTEAIRHFDMGHTLRTPKEAEGVE